MSQPPRKTNPTKNIIDLLAKDLVENLKKRDWTKPSDKLGKPDSPWPVTKEGKSYEGLTTKELEAANFSGFTINEFTNDVELWLLGRMLERETCQRVAANPSLLATMHERAFHTTGTIIEIEDPPIPPNAGRLH